MAEASSSSVTVEKCLICKKVAEEPVTLRCCSANVYCLACVTKEYDEHDMRKDRPSCRSCFYPMYFAPQKIIDAMEQKRQLRKDAKKETSQQAASNNNYYHPYKRPSTSESGLTADPSSSRIDNGDYSSMVFKPFLPTGPSTITEITWEPNPAPLPGFPLEESASQQTGIKRPVEEKKSSLLFNFENFLRDKKLDDLRGGMLHKLIQATATKLEMRDLLEKGTFIPKLEDHVEKPISVFDEPDKEEKPAMLFGPLCCACGKTSKNPVKPRCCNQVVCRDCFHCFVRCGHKCPGCHQRASTDVMNFVNMETYNNSGRIVNSSVGKIDIEKWAQEFKDLDDYALSAFIDQLEDVRSWQYGNVRNEPLRLTAMGMSDIVKKCKFDKATIQNQLELAIQDLRFINGRAPEESDDFGISFKRIGEASKNNGNSDGTNPPEAVDTKLERLREHFDSFCIAVNGVMQKSGGYSREDLATASRTRINELVQVTEGITKYKDVKTVAILNYDVEPNPSMAIITSLAFDRTAERFAIAGISNKIKVFNYKDFVKHSIGPHLPEAYMQHRSKISNISWSWRQENYLASADYDGQVSLWDIEKTRLQPVRTYKEHTKRIWAVDFSQLTPTLFASGSEDGKVRIFNINCQRSAVQVHGGGSVCCVYFSRFNDNHLFYGVSDQNLHMLDLRKPNWPVKIYRGHRRAVANVRQINATEVVSSSTDSTLRVWNIESEQCVNVLKGHRNDKSFVGLDNNGEQLVCGSENMRTYFYYKGLQTPVAQQIIAKEGYTPSEGPSTDGFVSAVAWKPASDYVLAANSLGRVQLLQLS